MTIDEIVAAGERAHDRAENCAGDEEAAAWMQVRMLAEIARQLAVMNGYEAKGPVTRAILGRGPGRQT